MQRSVRKKNHAARYRAVGGRSRWYYLLRGILSSLLITIPVFIILSAAMMLTDFPEEYLSPALLATVIVSVVLASFLSTAGSKNSGWFNGSLVGLLYMSVMMVVRWILENRVYLDKDILTLLLTGLLLGSISGMAGLHLTSRIHRDRAKNR